MKNKTIIIFVLITLFMTNLISTKQSSDEKPLEPPKNILILCSHVESWSFMNLTVIDLDNNELVLLQYSFTYEEGFLRKVIRTGMKVNLKLQKQIKTNCSSQQNSSE